MFSGLPEQHLVGREGRRSQEKPHERGKKDTRAEARVRAIAPTALFERAGQSPWREAEFMDEPCEDP